MYYSQNDEQKILFHISYRWHKLWPEKIEANTTIVQQHRLSIKIALMMFQVFDFNKKMVFCYHNCSDLLWEKFVLACNFEFFQGNEAKKSESRKSFEIHFSWPQNPGKIQNYTRTNYSNSERSGQLCYFEA